MIERQLSAADAALRQRITQLSVHVSCGHVRGPVQVRGRWQSCPDEDSPEKWDGYDVSRVKELCIVCARAIAGGGSRWSWLGCEDCRAVNEDLSRIWGARPLALGRHSLMNGIGIRGGMSPEVRKAQHQRLVEFVRHTGSLYVWRRQEVQWLATAFDPLDDVPLSAWQEQWPASRRASVDAISRLLGRELPLSPPK